jgi:hypothetical protein
MKPVPYRKPRVIGATVQNPVIWANLLPGFVHPRPQVLNIVFGDVSFHSRSVVGVKTVFLFSTRQTGRSQASRREYTFSSTDLIYVCTRVYKNNSPECPGMRLQNNTCSAWMAGLMSPLSTNMFSQSSSITTFLTDPFPYLHRSKFIAVICLFRYQYADR